MDSKHQRAFPAAPPTGGAGEKQAETAARWWQKLPLLIIQFTNSKNRAATRLGSEMDVAKTRLQSQPESRALISAFIGK